MDRDGQIKYNLECYLPYVCECVEASHLLQYLACYTHADRCELSTLLRTNPWEATRKAFGILIQKDEPGLFTALLQLLEEVYPKIAKLLQGEVVICDANYRHIIEVFTETIVKQIEPLELVVPLRRYDVITNEEAEETRAEMTNYGRTRAAFFMITKIHRHIEDWFKYFIMALLDTGCEQLAEDIDQDMVEKIKIQWQFASPDEEITERCFDDIREHVKTGIQEVFTSSKSLNSSVEASGTNMSVTKCETSQYGSYNIYNRERAREPADIKILNVSNTQDEITALKRRFKQSVSVGEEVENTDDESPNDLDKLSPETDDSGDETTRNMVTGRARVENSKYKDGLNIAEKEAINARCEKSRDVLLQKLRNYMERNRTQVQDAILHIQRIAEEVKEVQSILKQALTLQENVRLFFRSMSYRNFWEQEIYCRIQKKQKLVEERKENKQQFNTTAWEVEFRCLNCNQFICMSSDIRKIQNVHHVVIDIDVKTRLITFRDPHPRFMEDELKYDGAIFCGNPECQRELGGVCEYRSVEFPLLKIKQFRVVYKHGESRIFKQWKKKNFAIEQFSLDDLREVVDRRIADE